VLAVATAAVIVEVVVVVAGTGAGISGSLATGVCPVIAATSSPSS
jgi:hypothetical protein